MLMWVSRVDLCLWFDRGLWVQYFVRISSDQPRVSNRTSVTFLCQRSIRGSDVTNCKELKLKTIYFLRIFSSKEKDCSKER